MLGLIWAAVLEDGQNSSSKVGLLNCIEPSLAIKVARKNLRQNNSIKFIKLKIEDVNLKPGKILDIV